MLSFRLTASEFTLPLRLVGRGRLSALAVCAMSCAPHSAPVPPPRPAAATDACALAADSAPLPDTLTLAIAGTVDPAHALAPASDAERMVVRQLYETLVRLDCQGVPQPGLAAAWTSEDGGKRWTFTLRADAHFWDGQPVTARDVIASWGAGDTTLLGAVSLEAPDDRTLVVRVADEAPALAQRLADPALAVTRAIPGRDWPLGSGAYGADTAGGRVVLAPVTGAARPVIVLRQVGTTEARDWIDRGVDLLITDDRAALSYVAGRSDLVSQPLPWDRTYVLLAPGAPPPVTPQWRESLARDAVHVAARPAAAPAWWTAFPACLGPPPAGATPSGTSRPLVVYPRDDPTARDLAGRLVALEAESGGPAVRVAGLVPADLAAALAAGQSAQIVIPLPLVVFDPCGVVRRLVGRAPWLTRATQIVPLVETRRQVVWRRGAAAFTVEWDATLRAR
jgi:extracellular solute-binding protein (family 5)